MDKAPEVMQENGGYRRCVGWRNLPEYPRPRFPLPSGRKQVRDFSLNHSPVSRPVVSVSEGERRRGEKDSHLLVPSDWGRCRLIMRQSVAIDH